MTQAKPKRKRPPIESKRFMTECSSCHEKREVSYSQIRRINSSTEPILCKACTNEERKKETPLHNQKFQLICSKCSYTRRIGYDVNLAALNNNGYNLCTECAYDKKYKKRRIAKEKAIVKKERLDKSKTKAQYKKKSKPLSEPAIDKIVSTREKNKTKLKEHQKAEFKQQQQMINDEKMIQKFLETNKVKVHKPLHTNDGQTGNIMHLT